MDAARLFPPRRLSVPIDNRWGGGTMAVLDFGDPPVPHGLIISRAAIPPDQQQAWRALVDGLRTHGHRHVLPLPSPEALPSMVRDMAQPGDLVVCMGAGTITNWANSLPTELDRLFGLDSPAPRGGASR